MAHRPKWLCHAVHRSFHKVSDSEMKERLAEVFKQLLQRERQLRDQDTILSSNVHLSKRTARLVNSDRKDCA